MGILIGVITIYKENEHLFDDLVLPEGLDKELVIDTILMELGELSIIYSNPKMLQSLIGIWSKRRNFVWTEMYKTLLYKYNPIENYNRTEERVGRNDHIESSGRTYTMGEDSTQDNTQDTTGRIVEKDKQNWNDSGDSQTDGREHIDRADTDDTDSTQHVEHLAYGFNTEVPAKSWEDNTTGHSENDKTSVQNSTSHSENAWESGGNQTADSQNDNEEHIVGNTKQKHNLQDSTKERGDAIDVDRYKLKVYGNIGVTTTQQMIREQRDIIQFDLIDIIVKEFKLQFCLCIW